MSRMGSSSLWGKITVLVVVCGWALSAQAKYSGGSGTEAEPFRIGAVSDWLELMATPADWAGHFVLTADIDLNDIPITPVGNSTNQFTGVFDGNDYVIRNVDVNMPGSDYVGLFGYIGLNGYIANLGVENLAITGRGYVGGLAGYLNGGNVSACYTAGLVSGSDYVGGLVGYSRYGSMGNCYATATVNGDDFVGGLVGYKDRGGITNCYAAGLVSGNVNVGGLVGYDTSGSISRAYFLHPDDGGGPDNDLGIALSDTQMSQQGSFIGWDFIGESANGTSQIWQMPVGGGYPAHSSFHGYTLPMLAGTGTPENPYLISDANEFGAIYHYEPAACYRLTADIDLCGVAWSVAPVPVFRGGFDGDDHVIRNLDVNMPDADYVAFFGYVGSGARILNINLEGASIAGRGYVGGLVGRNNGGIVTNCHATGSVSGGGRDVGGLVGCNEYGSITNCCATGSVSGDDSVGCLLGYNYDASISNCYTIGLASGRIYVGGLVGMDYGIITNCYATASVSGGDSVGGLIGHNSWGDTTNCCAAGSVNGSGDRLGGLIGFNYKGNITNCYATATVNGDDFIGGLVGHKYRGGITNCYAAGSVSGDEDVGGLVGYDESGCFSRAYFLHPDYGGGPDNGYGATLTDTQMRQEASFIGWDFVGESTNGISEVWQMAVENGYPLLSSFCGYTPPVLVGAGTPDSPYLISEANELGAVYHYNLSACYRLTADIDLSGIGWSVPPIPAFAGTFDGNNHVIRNLHVNMCDADDVGLFGWAWYGARILNIGLEDASIAGSEDVGGLVGDHYEGSITNCYTTSPVSGDEGVGGLVGYNEWGDITYSYATGSVTGDEDIGGLVGYNSLGIISKCYATGSVSDGRYVGGLVGYNCGIVTNCHAASSVSGGQEVGGLVGYNHDYAIITNCYAASSVTARQRYVGGLVGHSEEGSITNCYATGSVSAADDVGGLVGYTHFGSVSNSYATSSITGRYTLGGLVGYTVYGTIINCYATGSVGGDQAVGGLVGSARNASISNCYAAGSVTGTYQVGGLLGWKDGGRVSSAYFLHPNDGGGPDNGRGEPLTEVQMRQQASFADCDFIGETANGTKDIWRMCADGVDYPRLTWEYVQVGDFACPDGVNAGDLKVLCEDWLSTYPQALYGADANGDNDVTFADFAILAEHWLSGL